MSSIAALLASKPRFCRDTSSTSTSTAAVLPFSSVVAVATPILVDLDARPRLQFDASTNDFKQGASQEPKKLKISPSPAHKVAIINRVHGDYYGQVAQLEFQSAVSTKSFKLEDTDEYKWLMNEVKLEAEDDQDILDIINAFPQPPSFSINKTDKRQKRQGVIFDFPKVQSGVDCGKWW